MCKYPYEKGVWPDILVKREILQSVIKKYIPYLTIKLYHNGIKNSFLLPFNGKKTQQINPPKKPKITCNNNNNNNKNNKMQKQKYFLKP